MGLLSDRLSDAKCHPTQMYPLINTPNIWGRGYNQRTPMYTLLDPKFAVAPISEVPRASTAHLEAVNGPIP